MALDVITSVRQKRPEEGWVVFRFRYGFALHSLVTRGATFALFASGGTIFLAKHSLLGDTETLVVGAFLGIGMAFSLALCFFQIANLATARSNMIVLTRTAIIRSLRGKVTSISYGEITAVCLTQFIRFGLFPHHLLEYRDTRGRIHAIAHSTLFHGVERLFQEIQSKGIVGEMRQTVGTTTTL